MSQIQLVLPKQAVNEVLDKIHCLVYSGHLGRRKTYKTMTERFCRPFLGKEIEIYVRSCDTCQKVKSSGNPNRAELNIILPQRTNEMVVTDTAGPFKTTVRGYNYLQIIADSFSKYLVCRPTKNKASMTVATNLLEYWCWTFGIPEKFLSN